MSAGPPVLTAAGVQELQATYFNTTEASTSTGRWLLTAQQHDETAGCTTPFSIWGWLLVH